VIALLAVPGDRALPFASVRSVGPCLRPRPRIRRHPGWSIVPRDALADLHKHGGDKWFAWLVQRPVWSGQLDAFDSLAYQSAKAPW